MRKISDSEKDELIEAQKQVIGILFEVIKRLQANNDLDEEYFQIVASKKTQKKKRVDKILRNLPDDLTKNYLTIWNEYNENISDEAKLVHEVDKLEMVIQALSYAKDGIEKEKLKPFFDSAKSQINSKQLKEILDKLLQ